MKKMNLVNSVMFFFLFRTTLLRWLTFLLASLNVTLTVSALLDLSISFDASICFKVAFPHFGNSDHVAVSVSVDISFKLNLIRVPLFITQLISYQVKPHSSPWFSTAGAAAIARKSHFRLYQQNKSSTSKVKFCQNRINLLHLKWSSVRLVIVAKGFLKLPNLLMLIKQNSLFISFQKLGSHNFRWIVNSFLNERKSAIPLFNRPEIIPCASDKTKLFGKKFSKNVNLDDLGISWWLRYQGIVDRGKKWLVDCNGGKTHFVSFDWSYNSGAIDWNGMGLFLRKIIFFHEADI